MADYYGELVDEKEADMVRNTEIDSDNISEGDPEDYVPEPPDGGWGWVVMCASFVNTFILDGIAYSFGVFLEEYVHYFNESVAAVALANALLCGVYLLVGPIVGALVNSFGCRAVGISGSVLGAIAFVLSIFSPNLQFMIFSYGFLGGCAFGMMYLPAVVGVGYYFEKKRAVATGIAVCGTGIGTFCLAPLSKALLQTFDWKSAHLFLAGLILQGCISSALMRPLAGKRKVTKADKEALKQEKKSKHNGSSTHMMDKSQSKLHCSAYIKSGHHIVSKQDLARPLYRRDIFLSGSIHNLAASRAVSIDHSDHRNYTASVTVIPENKPHRLRCLDSLPKPMADVLAEMLDLTVLRSKGMMVLTAANIIGMIGFYVPIMFSANRAEKLGVSPTQAAFLLSIMGICNTVGRVLSGFISMVPRVSPLLVNNISITLSGVAVMLTPFCTTYATMAAAIAATGLFLSTYVSLASVIMCELVGLEKLTNGFGLLCMVRGITAIAGPPFEGWLYDKTGDYDLTFYVGGACLIASGILHFLLHLQYFKRKQT